MALAEKRLADNKAKEQSDAARREELAEKLKHDRALRDAMREISDENLEKMDRQIAEDQREYDRLQPQTSADTSTSAPAAVDTTKTPAPALPAGPQTPSPAPAPTADQQHDAYVSEVLTKYEIVLNEQNVRRLEGRKRDNLIRDLAQAYPFTKDDVRGILDEYDAQHAAPQGVDVATIEQQLDDSQQQSTSIPTHAQPSWLTNARTMLKKAKTRLA
jgi:hypothetical protein